jgi:hypothetical protein
MNTNLQQSLRFATNALSDFARGMNFWSGFELAFGQDYDREKAELIRQAAIDGTFMVPVRVIDDLWGLHQELLQQLQIRFICAIVW